MYNMWIKLNGVLLLEFSNSAYFITVVITDMTTLIYKMIKPSHLKSHGAHKSAHAFVFCKTWFLHFADVKYCQSQRQISPCQQSQLFLSVASDVRWWMDLEFVLSITRVESWGESSCVIFMPFLSRSSCAIIMNASSMVPASLADVSRAATKPLSSASLQASSNSTARSSARSHLLPVTHNNNTFILSLQRPFDQKSLITFICNQTKSEKGIFKNDLSSILVEVRMFFWYVVFVLMAHKLLFYLSKPPVCLQLRTAEPRESSVGRNQTWPGGWCRRWSWPRVRCDSNSVWWCGIAPVPPCPKPASVRKHNSITYIHSMTDSHWSLFISRIIFLYISVSSFRQHLHHHFLCLQLSLYIYIYSVSSFYSISFKICSLRTKVDHYSWFITIWGRLSQ